MRNQRFLFQQEARWDWVADRVGTPDISPWKADKHKGGPERNKAGTRIPHNLLVIWVNIWPNAPSLANLDVFWSPGQHVLFSHMRTRAHRWHHGRKSYSHCISHTAEMGG